MVLNNPGRRGLRKSVSVLTPLAFLAGMLAVVGVTAPGATALTAPNKMTAKHLPTWQVNGIVWALAEHNGIVFAGGTFSAIRPPGAAAGEQEQQALNFAAFDAATGAPTDCGLSFTIGSGTATVRALDVSPDGKTLYAAGSFGAVNGHSTSRVAAIDIGTCTPKEGFRAANVNGMVRGLAVTNDTAYLGGEFTSIDRQTRRRFAALDTTGAVLPWRSDVAAGTTDGIGKAVALTPDGTRVVLGGNFRNMQGVTSHTMAVVNAATGVLLRSYPLASYTCRSGNDPFCEARSTTQNIYADDTGFYSAHEGTGGFDGRKAFNLTTNAQRWRDTCLGANQDVHVYEDVLYSANHAHNCGSNNNGGFPELRDLPESKTHQHMLAQSIYGSSAPPLLAWFPDTNPGTGEGLGPRKIVVSSRGGTDYLWIGGEFTRVGYQWGENPWQQGLTRVASGQANDSSTPSKPDQLSASTSSLQPNRATLRWRATRDIDDSMLRYQIFRDGSTTPVGEISASSMFWNRQQLSFVDTDVPGGNRTYQVRGVDGAGNASALSAAVTVNVPGIAGPPPPTDVSGVADAYVNEGASGTNYGTSSYLAVRGSLAYEAYLRYNLPAAPDGFVLQSAELRVRTTTQSFAASTDSHDVRPITGAWTETGATYNNRPGLSSTVLGTLPPVSELNTDYTITLDPAWLAGRIGQTVNLAMTSEGTDNVWLWSREHSSGGPQLHLVWGAP